MFSFQSDGFSLGSVYLLLLLLFSSWFVCLFTVPLCQLSAIANEQLAQTFAYSCISAMNAVNSKYDLVFVLWLDALIWTAWNSLARSARSIWVNGDKWKRKRLQYWCVWERERETVNTSQPEVNRARALYKLQIVVICDYIIVTVSKQFNLSFPRIQSVVLFYSSFAHEHSHTHALRSFCVNCLM